MRLVSANYIVSGGLILDGSVKYAVKKVVCLAVEIRLAHPNSRLGGVGGRKLGFSRPDSQAAHRRRRRIAGIPSTRRAGDRLLTPAVPGIVDLGLCDADAAAALFTDDACRLLSRGRSSSCSTTPAAAAVSANTGSSLRAPANRSPVGARDVRRTAISGILQGATPVQPPTRGWRGRTAVVPPGSVDTGHWYAVWCPEGRS
jgi:hypothetical protein